MSRLVIVSNRVAPIEEGKPASGGLSVAVQEAMSESGGIWFGWSGKISADNKVKSQETAGGKVQLITIDLNRVDYDQFYKGYSNATLWPLFHYRLDLVNNRSDFAEGYQRVNRIFAAKLIPFLQPDDLIWIHDYHLIPLARELRAAGFENRMGFFLHIPFPSHDVLTACSDHEDIVRALLKYDLVGFQTKHDVANFQDYVRNEAKGRLRGHRAEAFGDSAEIRHFPIGINPDTLQDMAEKAERQTHTERLKTSLGGRRLLIGVERLDYSKGLDKRFMAYETLLEHYPENRGGVTFLQIAPPSRGDVTGYREIRNELETIAGHVNGRFGEFDWVPIRYINKSFQRHMLAGFFRVARAALVTPLRDGMNLVAKEFVASQNPEDPGVLVLSEFAGAAEELDTALLVNPFDTEMTAEALQRALQMDLAERRERWHAMYKTLSRNSLSRWHREFVERLEQLG